jgi:hypothetical protein
MMDDPLYKYPHILLPPTSTTERFTSPKSGPRQGIKTPLRDRQTHSKALLRQLDEVREAAEQLDRERSAWGIDAQEGICIQFKSDPEFDLKFESLDYSPSGIELLAVREFEARKQRQTNSRTKILLRALLKFARRLSRVYGQMIAFFFHVKEKVFGGKSGSEPESPCWIFSLKNRAKSV